MTTPFRPRWYFFIALVSITLIGPLSLHLFIPAMDAVKQGFGVSTGMAQLTMSLAMLSMAFFTVAYGGLSDRFGRRRVLLGGLVLFTCGPAPCLVASNLPMVLAGALLPGAGAGWRVVRGPPLARAGRDTEIPPTGRHDPCVGIRAVPVGEAMLAIVLADHLLRHRGQCGEPRS